MNIQVGVFFIFTPLLLFFNFVLLKMYIKIPTYTYLHFSCELSNYQSILNIILKFHSTELLINILILYYFI